jgi:hypothetical protein
MNDADHEIIVIADPIGVGPRTCRPLPRCPRKPRPRNWRTHCPSLPSPSRRQVECSGCPGHNYGAPQLLRLSCRRRRASVPSGGTVSPPILRTLSSKVRHGQAADPRTTDAPLAAGDVNIQPIQPMLNIFNDFIPVLDGEPLRLLNVPRAPKRPAMPAGAQATLPGRASCYTTMPSRCCC